MAHLPLLRCVVVLSAGALAAVALASCDSGSVANNEGIGIAAGTSPGLGSAGVTTAPSTGTAGSPGTPGAAGSDTGVGSIAGAPASSGGDSSTGGMSNNSSGAPGAAGSATVVCDDKPPNNGDTCAHAVEYNWCTQSWLADSCLASCKKCTPGSTTGTGTGTGTGSGGASSSSTGSAGSAGSLSSGPTIPPVTGGKDGWASRYWDCCKPACGWSSTSCNKGGTQSDGGSSACSGGSAFMCYSFAPWAVSDTLSYGFVAAAGSNYSCGKCFQFTFNGAGAANSSSLNGKSMIVQVLNTGGDVADSQFDLLIPGGGVGQFNACSNQWGTSDLGAQYGGFATTCGNDATCIKNKCDTVFAGKPDLQAGCDWYLNWYGGADNPKFSYKEISCPAAITAKSGH